MSTTDKQDSFVSVVSVLHNDQKNIGPFIREVTSLLEKSFTDFELVLIDRRSSDNTVQEVEAQLKQVPSVRLIELSTSVSDDVAWAAGLENAIGDFVVTMTPGVDPPQSIPEVVAQCREGSDVVLGVAKHLRLGLGYRLVRPLFRWVLVRIGYSLPRNATNLRCLSRRAVNAVTEMGRFHHRISTRISQTGYRCSEYHYDLDPKRLSRRSLAKGARESMHLMVFNSTLPLRWMSGIGLLGSVAAFLFAAFSLVIHLFKDDVVEGWTSLMLVTSSLFALLFTILAFFGEYLGRLLDERSDQRDYHVVSEQTSSVMLDENRHNVLSESTSDTRNLVQTGRDR